MTRFSNRNGLITATAWFAAGAVASSLVTSAIAGTRCEREARAAEQEARSYGALGDVSDAAVSLRLERRPEVLRRWHVQRLEGALASARAASRNVERLEGPVPNLLEVVRKAESLLEANGSQGRYLEDREELEAWLFEKSREAADPSS